MYINDNTDKIFLKRLWMSRADDDKKMEGDSLDDGCHFGLLLDSLFDDINETLLFQRNSNWVDVYVDYNEIPKGGLVGSKDMVYGSYSEKTKLKILIIERIQLLRQLEEHRMAVWSYDGRDSRNYKHSSTAQFFSFGGNGNADYLMQHINETFVPTRHLRDFIDNGFMDNDEKRNRKLLRRSTITTWVAILTLIVAVITILLPYIINTLIEKL